MDRPLLGVVAGGAPVGLVGVGILLAAISMTASIIGRSDIAVEAISGTTVAVSVGAAVLVATGILVLALTKARDILLLAAAAALLLVVSVLGLFSIGILVLPFAVGAVYLVARRSVGRSRLGVALAAGPVMAVALAVLFVVWVQPPLVECTRGGATTSSRPWWSSGASRGEGSSTQSGGRDVSTGTIETPSGNFTFRCRDGTLTQFRRIGGR